MRVIAYLHQSSDFCAARSALLQKDGVHAASMRNAGMWREGTQIESGFDAVYAPDYPEIRAKYNAAGVPNWDGTIEDPPDPNELAELPQSDTVTILCPGKYIREEIAAHPPEGVVVCVNEAIHIYPNADYFIANDGFVKSLATAKTNAVRVCRRVSKHTLPGGPWFAMDNLFITDGMFTTRCALRLAALALKCKRIVLIGHDCTTGVGTLTEFWNEGHVESLRNAVASDLYNLSDKREIETKHVRWNAEKSCTYFDTYIPPMVQPVQPITRKVARAKK
jgi:hypothetical protein